MPRYFGSHVAFLSSLAESGSRSDVMTGTSYKSFPGMALDTINFAHRLHLVYRAGSAHNSNGGTVDYKYSDDDGVTWAYPGTARTLVGPSSGDDLRDPFIIVLASGRLLLGYDYKTPWNGSPATFTVKLIYSDDGGTTWSAPYTIPDTAAGNQATGTSQPIQLADNSILIFGNVNDTSGGVLYSVLWKSTDNGATFPTQIDVAKNIAVREYAEPQGRLLTSGRIICLLRSDTNQHTWRTVSSDNGATWSAPTDVLTASGRPDFVEVKPGLLGLFCRTNNTDFYARWTYSADEGLTWAALANTDGATDLLMYSAPVVTSANTITNVYSYENSSSDADLYLRHWLAS